MMAMGHRSAPHFAIATWASSRSGFHRYEVQNALDGVAELTGRESRLRHRLRQPGHLRGGGRWRRQSCPRVYACHAA